MTNVNPENSTNQPAPEGAPAAGGLPLRGLAMVLIAVAVLLGLWGLYSLTQDGDDGAVATSGDETEISATIERDGSSDAPGADADPDAPGAAERDDDEVEDGAAAEADATSDDARDDAADAEAGRDGDGEREARDDAAAPGRSTGAAGAGGAGATGASAKSEPVINVLNNSTVNGLAEEIYDRLADEGIRVGEHGNLPGEVATLKETTLYYHPGDIAGERAARDLGDRIGDTNGVPVRIEPNIDGLPEETTGPGKVTLALIGEVVL